MSSHHQTKGSTAGFINQTLLSSTAAIFLIVALLALAIYWLPASIGAPTPPSSPAESRAVINCEMPEIAKAKLNNAVVLDNNVTGGTITGKTFTVKPGVKTIALSTSLTLISDGDITISNKLTFATKKLKYPVNISLISLNGDITLQNGSRLSPSSGRDAADLKQAVQLLQAKPGINGGYIHLMAKNVNILGNIISGNGGQGGDARTKPKGIPATAVGGDSGFGGDILICAKDTINITGAKVASGWSRDGGDAISESNAFRSDASSYSGRSSGAGDIIFTGTDKLKPCQVNIKGQGAAVTTGSGGFANGGFATARAKGSGSHATAVAGAGGSGGLVLENNCVMTNNSAALIAYGRGGRGGRATAVGGDSTIAGVNGGDAKATGGNGGSSGHQRRFGQGGNASATPGGASNAAGKTGTATAQGGAGTTQNRPAPQHSNARKLIGPQNALVSPGLR